MQCQVCDQPLQRGWKYCPECGYDVEIELAPTLEPSPERSDRPMSGVRGQVFEVIVRQAIAGAPWREICAGPMQVNRITAREVEQEVRRRQRLLKAARLDHGADDRASTPAAARRTRPLELSSKLLEKFLALGNVNGLASRREIEKALSELEATAKIIAEQEDLLNDVEREAARQRRLDRQRGLGDS